jgi:hypothetical protein
MSRGNGTTRSSRGGKRVQRAKLASKSNATVLEALGFLETAKNEHIGEKYDPSGYWGLSKEGQELIHKAEEALYKLHRQREGTDATYRAESSLKHFWDQFEMDGDGYLASTVEDFLDEAIYELQH